MMAMGAIFGDLSFARITIVLKGLKVVSDLWLHVAVSLLEVPKDWYKSIK